MGHTRATSSFGALPTLSCPTGAQARWLDAEAHSWGPVVPGWVPVEQPLGVLVSDPRFAPTPVEWSQVPASFPEHLLIGHGAVDPPAVARARAVLKGAVPLPDRNRTGEWFARDAQARGAAHGVFAGGS